MASLNFVLSPQGVAQIHDAIMCLSKFSENIGWQASRDQLLLSALNSSKTAAAAIVLNGVEFFQSYKFDVVDELGRQHQLAGVSFNFYILSKALLSVFKGRVSGLRESNTSIESCEVSIEELGGRTELRLVVQMICHHGVIKTYKLTYEAGDIRLAKFEKDSASNRWTISAHVLKAFSEYFGARTENLDFYHENGRFLVTSYTERVVNGTEILKQPLQTSININQLDFEFFDVEEKIHIGIDVKDFRAIITHADSLRTTITAQYSQPGQPLQLTYQERGVHCEYTLMTIGEYRGASVIPAPPSNSQQPQSRSSALPVTQRAHNTNEATRATRGVHGSAQMPPPLQPASRSFTRELGSQLAPRPSPPPPQASVSHDSLFVQDDNDDDDDRQWGEKVSPEYEDNLRWEPSIALPRKVQRAHDDAAAAPRFTEEQLEDNFGVPPTQNMSQIRGMFD